MTNFLELHPGGMEVMMEVAGQTRRRRISAPIRSRFELPCVVPACERARARHGSAVAQRSLLWRTCPACSRQPGNDATNEFEDIGHSESAKKQLVEKTVFKGMLVGAPERVSKRSHSADAGSGGLGMTIAAVVVMALVAVLVQKFM